MHQMLSPLNLSTMVARQNATEKSGATRAKSNAHGAEEVTMWRCLGCREIHEERSDAKECCAPGPTASGADPASCPVCEASFTYHREAADCCLWKDIDAPTRWRIADAVEAGSTWAEELGLARRIV